MKKYVPTLCLVLILVFGVGLLVYPSASNYWNSLHQSKAIAGYVQSVAGTSAETYAALLYEASLYNEKIKPLFRDANLYHILPRPDHIHWDGVQYGRDDRPDNGVAGVVFLFKPTPENPEEICIRIRGLNAGFRYNVRFYEREEQSFTATGSDLMKNGLQARIAEESGSEMIFIEIV